MRTLKQNYIDSIISDVDMITSSQITNIFLPWFPGAAIPLFSFLLSWRLAVLQPCHYDGGVEKSFSAFEMSEQQSSVFQESVLPPGQKQVYY